MTLRIAAFEPFDSGSHRAVRESISRHSPHDWQWFTRPGRAWKWRMRLAGLELANRAAETFDGAPDVIFTTSLLNAAELRSALPARWRRRPLVLYMHENQTVYPTQGDDDPRDAHFALTNLASILTADGVLWNSAWNRDSFLDGIGRLLKHAPDLILDDPCAHIAARSEVVWPPVEVPANVDIERPAPKREGPIRVVWPHRWEHDKNPEGLLETARRWTQELDLRWTILGEQFQNVPESLRTFEREFRDAIDHIGFEPERERYWQHLTDCDWVLSTANHEFFGIAVVEALLAGCLPWLPMRLSYPELVGEDACGLTPATTLTGGDERSLRCRLAQTLNIARAEHAVTRLDQAVARLMASP